MTMPVLSGIQEQPFPVTGGGILPDMSQVGPGNGPVPPGLAEKQRGGDVPQIFQDGFQTHFKTMNLPGQ